MVLANQTRPHIANSERAVARYTNPQREVQWKTVVAISEYNVSTSDVSIIAFQRNSGLQLGADADADYASTATDRWSVSGGAVI